MGYNHQIEVQLDAVCHPVVFEVESLNLVYNIAYLLHFIEHILIEFSYEEEVPDLPEEPLGGLTPRWQPSAGKISQVS